MKTNHFLLAAAALLVAAWACTDENPDNGGETPKDGKFVPFKTFIEHYTAPEGDGEVVVAAKFDSQGRTNGFTITDDEASYQIVYEVSYGSDGKFTAVEKEVSGSGAAVEHRKMEGTLENGLLKEATVTEQSGTSRVSAEYDKDGHVAKYTTALTGGESIVEVFTWSGGNLTGYTSAYTDDKGQAFSYRFAYEYGNLENRSGLAALMAYPDDFYGYPIGFLLGAAFTKNVPVKKLSYNGNGEMDWGVEYTDFKTDSNGLVTSFLRKGLTEYSGDDFTYTLTY